MPNILIVYGSTTGNTEFVAERLKRKLEENDHKVVLLNADKAKPENLCVGYDCVLFGCSTWGDDSIELQDDFIPLFEDLESAGVKGIKAAVFGCGDSSYTYYCGAVDSITEKLEELGAIPLTAALKIDGDPSSAKDDIDSWADDVLKGL